MTVPLLQLPRTLTVDANGTPRSNAKLYVFAAQTTNPVQVWQDADRTIPHPVPIVSNAEGTFPPIYPDPDLGDLKINITDEDDVQIPGYPIDNIPAPFDLSASNISQILNPILDAERAAGITVVNSTYQAYQLQRYMNAAQLADYLASTASVDQTSAVVTAEKAAYLGGGGKIYAPAGTYLINTGAAVTLRSGVSLTGDGSGGSEYYTGSPWGTVQVTQFWRKNTGTAGPLFITQTADQMEGIYFRDDLIGGSTTGTIAVGTAVHTGLTDGVLNAEFKDLSFYGPAISGASLADGNCTAIYFYDGSVSSSPAVQRYFNRARGIRITNYFRAVRLGNNCNANNFGNIVIRQCYIHFDLNGGSDASCVENVFSGTSHFNIGLLPQSTITFTIAPTGTSGTLTSNWTLQTGVYPVLFSDSEIRMVTLTNASTAATWAVALTGTPTSAAQAGQVVVFCLQNGAVNNVFSGYSTECLGAAFYCDASSSTGNQFLGHENEPVLSVVPPGSFHSLWAQPNNRSQVSSIILPNVANPQGYTNGQGNLLRIVQNVGGTLPQLNGNGTLVAADVNSKVFARFNPTLYSKASQPGFRAKLSVYVNAPGSSVGEGIAEVEFWYRATDNSTHAASLSVISVSQKPSSNYIAGLKFLTGVASGLGFGLAIVGGNVSAVAMTHLIVDLEILAFTFSNNSVPMANYANITWGCVAATANDVTDAISLLTVADSAV